MISKSSYKSDRSLRDVIDGHDNNYTLLRLFLAASVIYFHSFGMTGALGYTDYFSGLLFPITDVGGLAVKSFFFLSGLFVTQSFFRDQNIANFVAKRCLRIWPGYFVCLVVTALLAVAVSRPGDFQKFLVFNGLYDYILRNAVFDLTWVIQDVFSNHHYTAVNGPIHTLPLEIKMYILLGIVGLLGLLRKPWIIVIAGIALLLLAFVPMAVKALPFNLFDAPYSRNACLMFTAGVITFGCAEWIKPKIWHGAMISILVVGTGGATHEICFYLLVIWVLLYLGQMPVQNKIMRPRNDLSYGVYIYGWPCQQIILTFFPMMNPYLLTASALSLATAFALVSWLIIEKPSMSLGQYLASTSFMVWKSAPPRLLAYSATGVVILLLLCIAMFRVTTIYNFAPVIKMPTRITNFGPQESMVGQAINKQPNGDSALWLTVDSMPPKGSVIVFDGHALNTAIGDNYVVTAGVPKSLLSKAGPKSIHIEWRSVEQIEKSNHVVLLVTPIQVP